MTARRTIVADEPWVLGISALYHDAAAALIRGGDVIAAVQEERLSGVKGDWRFPDRAIAYCRSRLPQGRELDAVAYYENPLLKADRILRNAIGNAPRGAPIWRQTLRSLHRANIELPMRLRALVDDPKRIHFVDHHRSHAASAYRASPFRDAAVLVVDGVGEWATTSLWHGAGGTLNQIEEIRFPHSLGLFYSAFTQYCGFKVNSGEYKLMGLAPYGVPRFRDRIRKHLIDIKPDGSFALNLDYFSFHTTATTISPLFGMLFGQAARHPTDPITTHFMNIAASAQQVLEEALEALAMHAIDVTGSDRLCLAGGVALNCVANARICRRLEGRAALWVQPAAGDAGGALGAALEVAHLTAPRGSGSGQPRGRRDGTTAAGDDIIRGAALGPAYGDGEMRAALESPGIRYQSFEGHETSLHAQIAEHLADGAIIGHFEGPMEFGPRALGRRSILADPRPADMLNRVNTRIKFREGWRPMAPVIRAEEAAEIFEGRVDSPYMLFTALIRDRFRTTGPTIEELRLAGGARVEDFANRAWSEYPAVTHVDYSARLQTVTRSSNPALHDVLTAFNSLTGCPMLLNTSFNIRGKPIVCSPEDAVRCFLQTAMDVLVLGPYVAVRDADAPTMDATAMKIPIDAD